MALADVLDTIAGLVTGITPAADVSFPFYRLDPADQRDIADVALERPRIFDVVAVGAPMETQFNSGSTIDYARHEAEVQVGYARAHWRNDGEFAGARLSDLASLVDAIRPPSGWSSVAHFVAVRANETRIETLTDAGGAPIGVVLILPLTLDLEV